MLEKKLSLSLILVVGFFWVLAGILGLIALELGKETILVIGVNSLNFTRWVLPFVHNAYYFTAGLIWLGLFFFAEAYFTAGARKKTLRMRICRFLGIEILLIALLQIILIAYRWLPFNYLSAILTGFEVILGIWLTFYPRILKLRPSQKLP